MPKAPGERRITSSERRNDRYLHRHSHTYSFPPLIRSEREVIPVPVPNFAPKKKSRGPRSSSGGADTMAIAKLVHAHADELTSMSEAKQFVGFRVVS